MHLLDEAHPEIQKTIARLRALPCLKTMAEAWADAVASEEFINGAFVQLARLPVELREHDRNFGTDTEVRQRRKSLCGKLIGTADALRRDADASRLTLYQLYDDSGPERIEWLWARHSRRPTLEDVLRHAAAMLQSARTYGTVKLRRDVVVQVALILDWRFTAIESVTGKRISWRHWLRDVAEIASLLLDKRITAAAAKKIIQRARLDGTKSAGTNSADVPITRR